MSRVAKYETVSYSLAPFSDQSDTTKLFWLPQLYFTISQHWSIISCSRKYPKVAPN